MRRKGSVDGVRGKSPKALLQRALDLAKEGWERLSPEERQQLLFLLLSLLPWGRLGRLGRLLGRAEVLWTLLRLLKR
ncbi:hypothetical protein [Thermus igniterrae]|uniref:hypothetical protein n=1 Tax=Thermus igniterrae TaxID=88189 RepID=UPI00035FC570|nr:hypothetical protein [Thermus igniterrae]